MLRETLYVRWLACTRIPLLFLTGPSVRELTAERAVVRIRLSALTRNHLGSMYFGVLACGADLAGGLLASRAIRASGVRVSIIFKDFRADFHKRVEGDCYFTCTDGARVAAMVAEAIRTGDRVTGPVHVVATVPAKLGDEIAASFELTLSLKRR